MTAAVLPQFVLLPSELLRCVFLLIADFGKYQVNRLKRIHFSSLDCQDFSPRAHPSPGRQREKESSCPSPKKQSRNPCGAPGPQLAMSADVLEENPGHSWVLRRSPMASELLWGVWVRGQQRWTCWALPSQPFSASQNCHGDSPSPDFPLWNCLLSLCGASCLSSRRWPNGFREHQNPGWCGRYGQGFLVAG